MDGKIEMDMRQSRNDMISGIEKYERSYFEFSIDIRLLNIFYKKREEYFVIFTNRNNMSLRDFLRLGGKIQKSAKIVRSYHGCV